MNSLFSKYTIKNTSLRNRIVMPPMCMYSAANDGKSTPWHVFHYRTRAQGGAAMIIQEATAVEPRGRISSNDLGIWDDAQIPGLESITEAVKAEGAVPAIQLAHAGRKCTAAGEDVIAPSPINFNSGDPQYSIPREMTDSDISTVVDSFRAAAARAAEAGYKVLEIHGAHGYLINEFLSPLTNKRGDEFGGSAENRGRLLKLVIQAVRSVWKEEYPLMLRVSAEDYMDNGNHPEDLAAMINLVKHEGLDIIHVSSGGVVADARVPAAPGYQIPAARLIRELTGIPVIGGGLITSLEHADGIVNNEDADLVFMGRELLRNPYFPLHAARDAGADAEYWPKQYLRAR